VVAAEAGAAAAVGEARRAGVNSARRTNDSNAGIRLDAPAICMAADTVTMAGDEMPLPLGVDAGTGRPLPPVTREALNALAALPRSDVQPAVVLEARASGVAGNSALIGGVEPSDLEQAGWGVIFAAGTSADVRAALQPLLDRRTAEAEPLFKVFADGAAPQPGETASRWLERHGSSMQVVDPDYGVPYYLLIVGSPEQIPFEFQYALDLYFAVGRLHFDTPAEYARYGDSVVRYETGPKPATARRTALFATTHDFDTATQLFTARVARPLSGEDGHRAIGAGARFTVTPYIGAAATKQTLADILTGGNGTRPSLLFSGTHGMALAADDPRQREAQGAIVCQDWEGYGAITAEHWFSAADVPADAQVHGLIHLLFACYGGGCPRVDNFQRSAAAAPVIAAEAMVSRLPQALLAHPNGGALAVIGHVERAWAYSFLSGRNKAQTQGFRDVLNRLAAGERAGQAMDQFNLRWAGLSTDLAEMLHAIIRGDEVSETELANRWVARDDARNYILFGDPAVRLRAGEMND
jgi:hypothetical protein